MAAGDVTLYNTATVDYVNESGFAPGWAASSTSFVAATGGALLAVSKLGDTDFWDDETAVYTIVIRNDGADTAPAITALDTLPIPAVYAGSSTPAADAGWAPASGPPQRLRWSLGPLGIGMTVSVDFTARSGAIGPPTVPLRNRVIVHYGTAWTDAGLDILVRRSRPSVPAGLSAVHGNGAISLAWFPSLDGRAEVSGYRVFRSDDPAVPPGTMVASRVGEWATSWTDSTVEQGRDYCYTVLAYDADGRESPASPAACAATGSAPSRNDIRLVVAIHDGAGRLVKVLLDTKTDREVTGVTAGGGKDYISASAGTGVEVVLSGGKKLLWDTRTDGGGAASSGFYTVVATSVLPDGRRTTATDSFAYVRPYEHLITKALLVPNPASEGVWLSYEVANPLIDLGVKIYNIAGELVYRGTLPGSAESWRWNLRNGQGSRVTSGLYLVVLEANDPPMGRLDRRILKLGIRR